MSLITVWNTGKSDGIIRDAIRDACIAIPALGLRRSDVTVCFVPDMDEYGPIVVVVELLFDKEERTTEVRQLLAETIGGAVKRRSTLGHSRTVEVAVKYFNPERDAFWRG